MKWASVILLAAGTLLAAADSTPSGALAAAQASLAKGDYARAIEQADLAAGEFRSRGDLASESLAVNLAGSAYLYRGEYDLALARYQSALALDRRQHDAKNEITHLTNIGSVYFFRGRYLDALRQYDTAMDRVEQTARETWNGGRRQFVLTNLAMLYEQLGQNRKALDYYQQALALANELTPTERGDLLSKTGTLYRRLGDFDKAIETDRLAESLYAQDHQTTLEIHVLEDIAITQALDLHDLDAAIATFDRALRLAQSIGDPRETLRAYLYRGEALYRMHRVDAAAADFREALTAARATRTGPERWIVLYGVGRIQQERGNVDEATRSFREALDTIEATRSVASSSLRPDFLPDQRAVYDAAISLQLQTGPRDVERQFTLFEHARRREIDSATLAKVQAKLASGSMLIEYWVGAGQLATLWATRTTSGIATTQWTDADATAIRQLTAAIQSASDWQTPAAELESKLLQGIPLSSSVRQLLIAPDGPLQAVPFELLGRPPLIEGYAVSYLPAAGLLLREPGWRTASLPWRPRLVAFGDPIVVPHRALSEDQPWTRLPGSAQELRNIAAALPGSITIHAAADDQKQYLLDQSDSDAPLLHFSTRAVADSTDLNRSRILFSPVPRGTSSEYLFRSEIAALELPRADLVTISACDNDCGTSIRDAFLAAGAQSTVTSLWRAPDSATALFMQRFYESLGKGQSKGAALRAAKLSFLRSGGELAQPRSWAAFILTGDGQQPIRPMLSWIWIVAPLLAATLVIAFLIRSPRKKS